jgi:hypothetical protein
LAWEDLGAFGHVRNRHRLEHPERAVATLDAGAAGGVVEPCAEDADALAAELRERAALASR